MVANRVSTDPDQVQHEANRGEKGEGVRDGPVALVHPLQLTGRGAFLG